MAKIKGWGTNLQNWNKKIRCCVIAPPGYKLWQIDQGGAEALIVAYLCQPGRFRSLFLEGIKPHVFVAMHIAPAYWALKLGIANIDNFLQCPITQLKNQPRWKELETYIKDSDNEANPQKRYYYIGKTCCHLLNYDATWMQFQLTALIKSEGSLAFNNAQSKYYRDLYRDTLFPEITYWHLDVVSQLNKNGRILRNLFGYPRKFNSSWDRELWKEGYAFIPQSTVGCITLLAQTEIQERLDGRDPLLKGVSLWQNGHDSLLGICPEENWREVCRELTPHIERDLVSPRGEKFKMRSGCSIGGNWGPFDEKKNPLGLVEIKL